MASSEYAPNCFINPPTQFGRDGVHEWQLPTGDTKSGTDGNEASTDSDPGAEGSDASSELSDETISQDGEDATGDTKTAEVAPVTDVAMLASALAAYRQHSVVLTTRYHLTQQGITQRAFAKKMGLKETTLGRKLRGETTISLAEESLWAYVLGIDLLPVPDSSEELLPEALREAFKDTFKTPDAGDVTSVLYHDAWCLHGSGQLIAASREAGRSASMPEEVTRPWNCSTT